MPSIRIEPLQKDNFDTWKIQAKALLIKNDGWRYTNGSILKTEANSEAWDIADQKAMSDLILAISPSELKPILKGCETSKSLWDKLHTVYQSKGPARKASLLKDLTLNKMKEGDDVREHINRFFNAVDKLGEMDLEINGELLAILLLYSLPESYENFRIAIETRDELPKPEELKIKIIEAADARKSKDTTDSDAFFVKKSNNNKFQKNQSSIEKPQQPKNITCFVCGQIGHKANKCRQRKMSREMSKEGQNSSKPEQSFTLVICDESAVFNQTVQKLETATSPWCIDSGCTSHSCSEKGKFLNLCNTKRKLNMADGSSTQIEAVGQVKLNLSLEKGTSNVANLENTLYVPGLQMNLMSVGKIADQGNTVVFRQHGAQVIDPGGKTTLYADRRGGLYYVRQSDEEVNIAQTSQKSDFEKWHMKFGHLHEASLRTIASNGLVEGLKLLKMDKLPPCNICIQGKMTQTPFPKSQPNRTQHPLEIIHTDVCGPMRVGSIGGSFYFAVFVDDQTRWCEVRFLKKKSDLFQIFKDFQALLENQTGYKIKNLQSDNGGEFCSKEMEKYLNEKGIKHRLTVAATPQQNGVAERRNRTLVEMARCMMLQSKVPASFWAEAIATANHVRNRCPSRSIDGNTPYTVFHGKKPDVRQFRTFGIKGYILDKRTGKGKFEPRAKPCTFVGYSDKSKGYRVILDGDNQVTISRDLKCVDTFEENVEYEDFIEDNTLLKSHKQTSNESAPKMIKIDLKPEEENFWEDDIVPADDLLTHNKRGPGRPKLVHTGTRGRPRKQYNTVPELRDTVREETDETQMEESSEFAGIAEIPIRDAMKGPEAKEWREAIKNEFVSMIENKSWDIIDRQKGRKTIGCRIVLRNKYNSDGALERRKARLVAKGYTQRNGVDYQETFAPVARLSSIRTVMALAAEKGLTVHQLDVTTAFLNGEVEEEIFMDIPDYLEDLLTEIVEEQKESPAVIKKSEEWLSQLKPGEEKVCKLTKALYGLKQAGRQWYKKLDEQLRSLDVKPLHSDPCIYVHSEKGSIMIIAVYVDDILIASNNATHLKKMKTSLSRLFRLRDLGPIHYCLGIEFSQCEKEGNVRISMSQKRYIMDLLERFAMQDCKPAPTPLDANAKLMKPDDANEKEMQRFPYQSLIGSLMYLAVGTRPDIAFCVSSLSQFNTCYTEEHWKAAKRVLRFLKGTADLGITYHKTGDPLKGYVDADWGGCVDDRRSYTGYMFKFGGAAISWEARKQRTVALSSTESEYMGLTEATKEAIYLGSFLREIDFPLSGPIPIYNDNQGAQLLVRNPVFHSRTKHIGIRHHFVREAYEKGLIEVRYLCTEDMPADILTKGLFAPKHSSCTENMGVIHITRLNT